MYLVDGYNLLYSTDLDTREELISSLNKFCVYRKKRAKIVFDGYSNENLNTELVEVEFAGDADKSIAEIVETCDNPSYYILVTSDKELKYIARKNKIKTIRSDEFNFQNPDPVQIKEDESENFFLTETEVEEQLKEFNYFQKS